MIIVPLVMSSIICGVAGLGSDSGLGRLGVKTIGFYLFSSLAAIMVGLILVNLFAPGIVDGSQPVRALISVPPRLWPASWSGSEVGVLVISPAYFCEWCRLILSMLLRRANAGVDIFQSVIWGNDDAYHPASRQIQW
ncbi:MAG: cation:dicarboxylase symporter family transporter [Porticoccaceae bacterium]